MPSVEIKLEKLTKFFKEVKAVDSVSLEIYKGEIFGLLGPNGAGKTTIIRMLSGLARPTSGSAQVAENDIVKDSVKVRRIVGVVPQSNVLDRELTVSQNLRYHAKLHGMKKSRYEKSITNVLALVGMKDKKDSDPLTLSGGMKRRLTIAKALIHEPEVLFLDEPTTGLDPQSKRALWDRIQALSEKGITMILTTHYMEEAELLCDRIGIIDKGKIIALDTPRELKKILKGEAVIEVTHDGKLDPQVLEALDFVGGLDSAQDNIHIYTTQKKKAISYLFTNFEENILSVDFHEPTLEDVFLHLTVKELKG
ncbi:MAG: ATP-binding cassette domain-containing protein [Methanomassiliicoccales archaeon]|nr:MAG: ATP-binding cassette domain-containing protein [Methanomassiliicoccales archaeon]